MKKIPWLDRFKEDVRWRDHPNHLGGNEHYVARFWYNQALADVREVKTRFPGRNVEDIVELLRIAGGPYEPASSVQELWEEVDK